MRIVQMLPTLAFGDAIGNDTLTIKDTLVKAGYETEIYAEGIDAKLGQDAAKHVSEYKCQKDDIILYHLSTGTDFNYKITEFPCKRMIMYHNITPPHFFKGYSPESEKNCADGLRAAKYLAKKTEFCIADSGYNKNDLRNMGYTCEIEVMPILIAFDDYKKEPDKKIMKAYDDDWVNIIFTGRVVPNKCPQDVIAAFAYYKKYINPKSRLFLVGTYSWSALYKYQLDEYVKQLGVKDVHMTGHIRFEEILAYYRVADAFVCMSEHEGFCVPLVESMFFKVPIIAYDSSAISDTLGGSGLLLSEKDPAVVAEAIRMVTEDQALRQQLIDGQTMRLQDFSHDKIKAQFLNIVEKYIAGEK